MTVDAVKIQHRLCSFSETHFGKLYSNRATHHQDRLATLTGQGMPFPQHGNDMFFMSRQTGGKKPFTCEICGNGYMHMSGLSRHRIMHKGMQFNCPLCDNKFTQKYSMKLHLKSVHNSTQCPNCSMIFTGASYDQHLLQCLSAP